MTCILRVFFVLLVCVQLANAQALTSELKKEGIASLAKAAREKGDAIRGSILLPQEKLGCANCHLAGNTQLLGPDLTQLDQKTTDEYLVESILSPSKSIKEGFATSTLLTGDGKTFIGRIIEQNPNAIVLRSQDPKRPTAGGTLVTIRQNQIEAIKKNKVSAMPENLPDLLTSRQDFLDLVKYLMQLAATDAKSLTSTYTLLGGKPLDEAARGRVLIDRFRCEACHQPTAANLSFNQAPNLVQSFGNLRPDYVERFVTDPQREKPGTLMPQVMGKLTENNRQAAAKAITHYLNSLAQPVEENIDTEALDTERGQVLFHSVGCVACHSPRDSAGKEILKESSIALGNLKAKYSLPGLVTFLKNPHVSRPGGRMPNLKLTHWEASDIAGYILDFWKTSPIDNPNFHSDETLISKGKKHFQEFACAQCHVMDQPRIPANKTSFARMDPERGCLSSSPGKWPMYRFTETQKTAIQAAIRQPALPATPEQKITNRLAGLNCYACHQRNGLGGVSEDREEYFQTTNLNLGPQGRIPPSLTGVGAKLQPKALRDVLINGQAVRPYMKTRMPQFGEDNTAPLIEFLNKADELPPIDFGTFKDEKKIRDAGWELAGTGGLNCIACHTFQLKPAKTMPALDLTVMSGRLEKRWFYHYLQNPQFFHPGTVMPSFWPGGKAMRKEILEGQTNLQIEALWQYLLDGRQARTPRGLIVKPIELLATDEAVMLRRSYPNIGKRGIGVGYPTGVNIAFDAEQMRLGTIWKGKFADPGGVWRSQGHGTVRPLGENVIHFAKGPELHDPKNPWTTNQGRPPDHQFRGYFLDDKQRPTFQYQFRDVKVQDFFEGIPGDPDGSPSLKRTITLNGKSDHELQFRAAFGKSVTSIGKQTYQIDDHLKIQITSPKPPAVIESPTGQQLVIPVDLSQGKSQLVLQYYW